MEKILILQIPIATKEMVHPFRAMWKDIGERNAHDWQLVPEGLQEEEGSWWVWWRRKEIREDITLNEHRDDAWEKSVGSVMQWANRQVTMAGKSNQIGRRLKHFCFGPFAPFSHHSPENSGEVTSLTERKSLVHTRMAEWLCDCSNNTQQV